MYQSKVSKKWKWKICEKIHDERRKYVSVHTFYNELLESLKLKCKNFYEISRIGHYDSSDVKYDFR